MSLSSFSYKSGSSGCCRKCGKPLEWSHAPVIAVENTTPCMVSAQSHINDLQKVVARNTSYCSECSTKIKHDLILDIVLFPFNVVRFIIRLVSR